MLRKSWFIAFTIVMCSANAQEPGVDFYRQEVKNERFEAGSPFISGAIIPSYSPEMEFNFAGAMLLTFKTRRNNPYLKYSNFPLVLSVTPGGDILFSGTFTSYWSDDRFRIVLFTSYLNRDDNYWGVGMDKAESVPKGELTTAYHQEHSVLKPVLSLKIGSNFYAGLLLSRLGTVASQLNELMSEDPDVIACGTSYVNSGLGISVNYDTRDFITLPKKGIFAGIEGIIYNEAFLSDNNFNTLEVDFRQYISAIRTGSVIAWQANARFSTKEIPWTDMPQLGSMNDLRGYYYGQFRDRSAGYILLEYRHTFLKNYNSEPSRHGIIFCLGGGTAFENISSIDKGIVSLGLGYRYQIQPKSNLRFDLGFGTDFVGLYLSFYEAF